MTGTRVSDTIWEGYPTNFIIGFDQVVSITEAFYPPLSFSKILTDIGGTLGFWLGIGLMQICSNLVNFMKHVQYYINFK